MQIHGGGAQDKLRAILAGQVHEPSQRFSAFLGEHFFCHAFFQQQCAKPGEINDYATLFRGGSRREKEW